MVVTTMIDIEQYGLHLERVKLPFRLNHVNCFLAEGEDGWTLIDTGLNNSETNDLWNDTFKGKKLERIIVTHEHPDHLGSAGYLQEKYGVDIYTTKKTEEFGSYFMKDERVSHLKENYEKAAVPRSVISDLLSANDNMKRAITPLPNVTHYLKEYEKIKIGPLSYEIIYTPGHAEGLITLFNKENRILISTDHILPRITPN